MTPTTTIVALTPAEMVPAQTDLLAWIDKKLQALADEADELALLHSLASENGWKTSVAESGLNRATRRIRYYAKMKAALAAGFLLVPNMPIDILAVRVDRAKQPETTSDTSWTSAFTAKAQLLPPGVGRYVDETVQHRDESYIENVDGKPKHITHLVSDDYDEVDWPVQAQKPVILTAAAKAMALKIFDRIGIVQNQGKDPILVGHLIDPRHSRWGGASFFIAWWVDPATL